MALVVVTGVRALRVPNEECLQVWQKLSQEIPQIAGRNLEDFLEYPIEMVQNADLPHKDTLLQLHRQAGVGFRDEFKFEITFDCREPGIKEDLEWKLTYVGSAADEKLDQELDSVMVGPVTVGRNKFMFQAPAPDPAKVPDKDLLEVTVLLLTCLLRGQEFIRIGYYVNNDFGDNQELNENRPEPHQVRQHLNHIRREIVNKENPRVTRFQINWEGDQTSAPELQFPAQPAGEEEDEENMGDDYDSDEEEEESNEEEDGDEDLDVEVDLEDDDEAQKRHAAYQQQQHLLQQQAALMQQQPQNPPQQQQQQPTMVQQQQQQQQVMVDL